MSKQSTKKGIDYSLQNNRIRDKIITLLFVCGASTLRSINNLSSSREACSREKKKLKQEGYIQTSKRAKFNSNKKNIVVRGTKKLIKELGTTLSVTNELDRIKDTETLQKRLVSAEITSNFIRMGKDIYLGEASSRVLTNNYFVTYAFINEFLTGEKTTTHDNKVRLINGMYISDDCIYPIYYIAEYNKDFYYQKKKSNILQQSRIRKLPKEKQNIIYLMSKTNHKDILKRFILNEEKRTNNYDKFYRFDWQKNDTLLIPGKADGTYEITKFAIEKELNENYKKQISEKLEAIGLKKFYQSNYFFDKGLWCIYMPVIKVDEMRKIINEIKRSEDKEINIGLITFAENIDLVLDYIKEVLVKKQSKKVTVKIMNDLQDVRERKKELKQNTFVLE